MRAAAIVTAVGAGVLVVDAVTGTYPDVAIIGVALVLAGIAGAVLSVLLPPQVVPPHAEPRTTGADHGRSALTD